MKKEKVKNLRFLSVQRKSVPAATRQLHSHRGGWQAASAFSQQRGRGRPAGRTRWDPREMEVSKCVSGGAEEKPGRLAAGKFSSSLLWVSCGLKCPHNSCAASSMSLSYESNNTDHYIRPCSSLIPCVSFKALSCLAWTGKVSQSSAVCLSGKSPSKVVLKLKRLSKRWTLDSWPVLSQKPWDDFINPDKNAKSRFLSLI